MTPHSAFCYSLAREGSCESLRSWRDALRIGPFSGILRARVRRRQWRFISEERVRPFGKGDSMKLLSALALAAVLAIALLLHGCGGDEGGEFGRSRTIADQEVDGFTLTQTREGARVWSISANHALVYDDADRVEMMDLRVDFFDEDGEIRSTLTANEGILARRTNDMEVLGNVVVYAADGTILTTDKLTWNERKGKVESDRPVRVTKGDDVMTGVGVEADPDLKNIRVRSDFRAFVRTPEGELVEEE